MNGTSDKLFTRGELLRFDGDREDRVYIAHNRIVYDVTDCPKWRTGLHENLHFGGQDLTHEILNAPHNLEVFNYPCVKQVGRLLDE